MRFRADSRRGLPEECTCSRPRGRADYRHSYEQPRFTSVRLDAGPGLVPVRVPHRPRRPGTTPIRHELHRHPRLTADADAAHPPALRRPARRGRDRRPGRGRSPEHRVNEPRHPPPVARPERFHPSIRRHRRHRPLHPHPTAASRGEVPPRTTTVGPANGTRTARPGTVRTPSSVPARRSSSRTRQTPMSVRSARTTS